MIAKTDEYFKSKITHLYDSVQRDCYPKFSAFLDTHQYSLAHQVLNHKQGVSYSGGYEQADRQMLCVYPDYIQPDDLTYPIAVLQLRYKKEHPIGHRDVLGSLMALQIKRETVGDIIVSDGLIELILMDHLADFVQSEIQKIGRVGVTITRVPTVTLANIPKFQSITGTVSSMRLDSMIALATRLSRGKAVQLLGQGKVLVNHCEVTASDFAVKQSDILTIRGFGKYVIASEPQLTRKMRYHITIHQYL